MLKSSDISSQHRIKWEEAETLVHFASLLPNVIDVGLGYHSNIAQVNHLFRAFPSLVSFSLGSNVDTTYQGPFIDLPQPVSNTIIPSHLQCLHLTCYGSRLGDRFIQRIPLGSIQLSEFYIQISTAEGRIYLKKLILFIRRHCLNVSTLRMAVIVRHLPAHWDIDRFFDTGQSYCVAR